MGEGRNVGDDPLSDFPRFYPFIFHRASEAKVKCLCCEKGHYSLQRAISEMLKNGTPEKSGKKKCSHCENWMNYTLNIIENYD